MPKKDFELFREFVKLFILKIVPPFVFTSKGSWLSGCENTGEVTEIGFQVRQNFL